MGLIKTVTTVSGITVPNAYIQGKYVNGSKESLTVEAFYFVSKAARLENSPPFQVESISFSPSTADNAPNYHKQFYDHAKTLPKFAGAVDDLDY